MKRTGRITIIRRIILVLLAVMLAGSGTVSAAEVNEQDIHHIIVIGAAAIAPNNALADSMMDEISSFVENNTEAEILDEIREIR